MAAQLERGRRIGIDFGDVRIGVAVCDLEAILVSPLKTLVNDQTKYNELQSIFAEVEPIYLAIGNPIHLSGDESKKSKLVQEFVASLRQIYRGKIFLIDERFSTKNSIAQLHELGKGVKEGKSIIDQMAAVQILNQAILLESSPSGLGSSL
jgi:putative Holliday junction resolvase